MQRSSVLKFWHFSISFGKLKYFICDKEWHAKKLTFPIFKKTYNYPLFHNTLFTNNLDLKILTLKYLFSKIFEKL
jgi:hypothetical protein